MEIKTSMLTVFEAYYLLKNFDGYIDGDKKCLVIV